MKTNKILLILLVLTTCLSTSLNAQKDIYISGRVIDAEAGTAIKGAELSIIDELGKRSYQRTTNSNGDFEIITKLQPGQYVTIEVKKEGYTFKELRHKISMVGSSETIQIELLKGVGNQEITVSGFIIGKKNLKPVENAKIYYFNQYNRRVDVGYSSDAGFFTFGTNQKPGESIKIHVDKTPRYKLEIYNYIIPRYSDNIWISLKKKAKISPEWYFFGGSAVALITSLATKIPSDNNYEKYEDLTNPNREAAFDKANSLNKTAIVSLYTGIAAAVGGGAYLLFFKDKDDLSGMESRITPTMNYHRYTGSLQIGFQYQF